MLDDRPFGGPAPPAAIFQFSSDRTKEHPVQHLAGWQGVLQAEAHGGYNDLYCPERPTPITSALLRAHERRKFLDLADGARQVHRAKPVHEIFPGDYLSRRLPGRRGPLA